MEHKLIRHVRKELRIDNLETRRNSSIQVFVPGANSFFRGVLRFRNGEYSVDLNGGGRYDLSEGSVVLLYSRQQGEWANPRKYRLTAGKGSKKPVEEIVRDSLDSALL